MKIFNILLILFGLTLSSYSQNLVLNGSFETGSPLPDGISQIPRLLAWENFDTSDWYHEDLFSEHEANTGKGYIGFGPCEGVQAQLARTISSYELVSISFYVAKRTNYAESINIYLMEEKADEDALANCSSPDISANFVKNIPLRGNPGEWIKYEIGPYLTKDFKPSSSNDKPKLYNWLAIKGANEGGAHGSIKYVYLDDIKISAAPLCSTPCSAGNNDEVFNYKRIMGLRPNSPVAPLPIIAKNATQVDFYLYNRWGGIIMHKSFVDVNGLGEKPYISEGDYNRYFRYEWRGRLDNGAYPPEGTYVAEVVSRGCDFKSEVVTGSGNTTDRQVFLTVIKHPYSGTYLGDNFSEMNNLDFNSSGCDDGRPIVLENRVIPSGRYRTSSTISTYNNAIILDEPFVELTSSSVISLRPGFSVAAGADFRAIINTPNVNSRKKKSWDENDPWYKYSSITELQEEEEAINSYNKIKDNLRISPNPSETRLIILSSDNSSEIIEGKINIYDALGNLKFFKTSYKLNETINLSSLAPGFYNLQLIVENEIIIRKLVLL